MREAASRHHAVAVAGDAVTGCAEDVVALAAARDERGRPFDVSAEVPAARATVPSTGSRAERPSGHNGLAASGLSRGWSYMLRAVFSQPASVATSASMPNAARIRGAITTRPPAERAR